MDIPATEQEMEAWVHRGGKMPPNDPLAEYGIKTPGGLFGAEFSDSDWAAYLDALKKLGHAKGLQQFSEHLKAANLNTPAVRPDATAVTPPR